VGVFAETAEAFGREKLASPTHPGTGLLLLCKHAKGGKKMSEVKEL